MNNIIFYESLLRSLLIAAIAVVAGRFISRGIGRRGRFSSGIMILLLFSYLTPAIATGYGYLDLSSSLIQKPFLKTLLYIFLEICRLSGPAALLLAFIPSSVPRESIFCYRMSGKISGKGVLTSGYIPFIFRVYYWRYSAVLLLVFILSFSEFELASIMNIKHWSVVMFDSYAHGISSSRLFTINIVPFLLQVIISLLFISLIIFSGGRIIRLKPENNSSMNAVYNSSVSTVEKYTALIIALISFGALCAVPFLIILRSALPGLGMLFSDIWMIRETFSSLLFALASTLAASFITIFILRHIRNNILKLFLMVIFLPGLVGKLTLSLAIQSLFQIYPLSSLYNTPVPLLTALILISLPFTAAYIMITGTFRESESQHSAGLLYPFSPHSAATIIWETEFKYLFWMFFFLFILNYADLTASSILAPDSMTTVTTRCYNLMHYGESEKLSATVCVITVIPLLLFAVAGLLIRFIIRRWRKE